MHAPLCDTRHHTSSSPLIAIDYNNMCKGVNPLLNDNKLKKNAVIVTPLKNIVLKALYFESHQETLPLQFSSKQVNY